MRKHVKFMKNDTGSVSQLIGAIFAMLAIVMVFVALTAGLKALNQYNTLNDFGNQMIQTAGREGRCSGTSLEDRYNELSAATNLHPDVEFSASYFNEDEKTVQFGETITLQLTLHTELSAVGISIPLTLPVRKTTESEHYWK